MLLYRILRAVSYLLYLLEMALFARAILSWFQGISFLQTIYEMMVTLTEPIVGPVRRMIHKLFPGSYRSAFDFSVLAAMVLIELVRILIL